MSGNSSLNAAGWQTNDNFARGNQRALDALTKTTLPGGKCTGTTRLFGNTSAATNALDGTRCVKMEAEAEFDSVRLHLYHRLTNAPTAFSAAVAATETASLGSLAVAFQPTVAGAQTAALRAAVGAPGWAAVTFGGASTGDIAAATSTRATVLSSDWIELPSVPRADGGTRPLLMVRVYHDGATDGAWVTVGQLTTDASADSTAWQNASTYPWWRQWQAWTIATTDGVTDLTANPASTTLSNATLWLAVEFGYRRRAISLLGIGDSITENSQFAWGAYGSWGMRGCALASTPDKPVCWFQGGSSGQPSSVFTPTGEDAIALHKPTHVLFQLLSPNSPDVNAIGTLTSAEASLLLARVQRVARACRDAGSRLVLWSGIPNNAYTVASDNIRKALNAAAVLEAGSGMVDFIDLEGVASNGESPARLKSSFDNTHPNNVLLDRMSLRLRDYLLAQVA
jgi:hypothetical protein